MDVEPAYCELECLFSSVTSLWEHAMTIKVLVFQTIQLLACYCTQGYKGRVSQSDLISFMVRLY